MSEPEREVHMAALDEAMRDGRVRVVRACGCPGTEQTIHGFDCAIYGYGNVAVDLATEVDRAIMGTVLLAEKESTAPATSRLVRGCPRCRTVRAAAAGKSHCHRCGDPLTSFVPHPGEVIW